MSATDCQACAKKGYSPNHRGHMTDRFSQYVLCVHETGATYGPVLPSLRCLPKTYAGPMVYGCGTLHGMNWERV